MFSKDDPRSFSGLQQLLFCDYQCALIHIAQL